MLANIVGNNQGKFEYSVNSLKGEADKSNSVKYDFERPVHPVFFALAKALARTARLRLSSKSAKLD